MGFDTTTLISYTGTAANALGSTIAGVNTIQAGNAVNNISQMNADQLDQEAERIRSEGRTNIGRARYNQATAVNELALARSARNVTSSGSALNTELSTMQQAEIGINDIATKAANEARTLNYQATIKRWEAEQARKKSKKKGLKKITGAVGSVAGAVVGGITGGAGGAAVGAKIGGTLGGM